MSRIYEASYEVTQKGRLNQFLKSFSLKGYSQEKMTRWPVDIWQGCQSHWPSGKYSTPTRISKFKRPTISSADKLITERESVSTTTLKKLFPKMVTLSLQLYVAGLAAKFVGLMQNKNTGPAVQRAEGKCCKSYGCRKMLPFFHSLSGNLSWYCLFAL